MKITTILKSIGTLIAGVVAEGTLIGTLSPINTLLFGLTSLFLITLAYELQKEDKEKIERQEEMNILALPV